METKQPTDHKYYLQEQRIAAYQNAFQEQRRNLARARRYGRVVFYWLMGSVFFNALFAWILIVKS